MFQVLLLADKYLENPDGGESLSVSSELVSDKRQKRRRPPISVENSISMKADEEKVVQKKELNTVNDNATPGVQLGIQTKNSSRQNGGISTEPRVALPPRKRAKDGKPLSAAETIFLYGADWDDADTEVKAAKPSQRKSTKPMLPKSPQNSSRQSSRGSSRSSTPSLSAEAAGGSHYWCIPLLSVLPLLLGILDSALCSMAACTVIYPPAILVDELTLLCWALFSLCLILFLRIRCCNAAGAS